MIKRFIIYFSLFTLAVLCASMPGCRLPLEPEEDLPYVVIDSPPPFVGPGPQSLTTVIVFDWHSGPGRRLRSVRYMWSEVIDTTGTYDPDFDIIDDLNNNPRRYRRKWSDWISYHERSGEGCATTLGDDEELETGKFYMFAVQAMDRRRKVTNKFDTQTNARRFIVLGHKRPLLTVREPFLGTFRFLGTEMRPTTKYSPPGTPLNFSWKASVEEYGGKVAGYRYGWDVEDLENLRDWDVLPNPDITTAPERSLQSGTHAFYVEAVDNAGGVTLAEIIIEVVPFTMERSLLWVDDFYATDPQPHLYEHPGETNHDEFWLNICSRAVDFIPERDVYDCYYDHGKNPPTIRDINKYKNIIWTYTHHEDAWSEVVAFTPESEIGQAGSRSLNYLPIFLAKGGHLWTLGRSEQSGGLAAVFGDDTPLFPASFEFDMSEDPSDSSGKDCMGYRDYCVTTIDKVWGSFRVDPDEVPPDFYRTLNTDAMRYAYRDEFDPVTALHPELPNQLDLWDEVTMTNRFFDRRYRGFIYVEVYDPDYWMDWKSYVSQSCFHPMYRMKARSSVSVLDDCAVAIWVTKYDDIVPDAAAGPAAAAPSVHFGFPLWFFNRGQVDQIVDVIFNEWQILGIE